MEHRPFKVPIKTLERTETRAERCRSKPDMKAYVLFPTPCLLFRLLSDWLYGSTSGALETNILT